MVTCYVPLPPGVVIRMVAANGSTAQASAICLISALIKVVAPDCSQSLHPFVFIAFAVPLGKSPVSLIVSNRAMVAAGISCNITDGTAPDFIHQPSIHARYGAPLPPTMPPVFRMFTLRALALHENLARAAITRSSA